jgi:hypothetical protein
MTLTDILELVHEVDSHYAEHGDDHLSLQMFVALIEKAERESCIKALENDGRMMAAELLRKRNTHE